MTLESGGDNRVGIVTTLLAAAGWVNLPIAPSYGWADRLMRRAARCVGDILYRRNCSDRQF